MARIFAIAVLVGWLTYRLVDYYPDQLFHLVVCDVGQGDAILISRNSFQMLIDGGKDNSVLGCLNSYIPPWDRTLEVMVVTHPHSDHINGLVPVLDNFEVKTLVHNGQLSETADFERFKEAVQKEVFQGVTVKVARQNLQIRNDENIDVTVLYPENRELNTNSLQKNPAETLLSDVDSLVERQDSNYNDQSVVLKVRYGDLDVLLTGDLEEAGEQALVSGNLIGEVEVLKVGHHGAKTSSTPGFVGQARPEISVISAGKNNSYGHPDPQTLQALTREKSLIMRTDLESTIELVSDGHFLWKRKAR